MGKREQKKPRKSKALTVGVPILGVIVLAALLLLLIFLPRQGESPTGSGEESSPSSQSQPVSDPSQSSGQETPEPTGTELPLALEGGALELTSLFQFSGINPDSGNQEGTDIASILIKNTSDTYLSSASLTVTLTDATVLNFMVTDLPAGKSAMAFSLENQSIGADAVCDSVKCEAVFDPTAVTQSDRVSVSVEGTLITLTNNTGEDISELVIYCRSPLNEDYFGGMTYQYTIRDLAAAASTTVNATDCILGMAEVVRITVNE